MTRTTFVVPWWLLPVWALGWIMVAFFRLLVICFVLTAGVSVAVIAYLGREIAAYFASHGPTPLEDDEVQ